ncbi:MAG TPA: FxLYD domain-containing protein [Methylomirabilota bacterium]|nr:FxLYD domain-containing protein [Methylomirabilota bacterium]
MYRKAALALLGLAIWVGTAAAQNFAVIGADRYFAVRWERDARGPAIRGSVDNEWGVPARDVRVVVDGLDGAGGVVEQRVGYVQGQLTPGARGWFQVPVTGRAADYRVRVLSWEWIQTGGDQR